MNAREALMEAYDKGTMEEIAGHGCKSGVCHEHIYYGDTITFFDKYEAEILDLIHIRYGSDTLVDIFKQHDADYDAYRNDCCWLFIENVAQDVIQDLENEQLSEDEQIESYMKEEISNNGYTLSELNKSAEQLMSISGVNPPNSMTLNRYLHH